MRLTLRTMLAYMDEVLEPADADILAKKIEESDFASGLMDRISGVLRKLRMDAPRLDGKGMGNDANTVAEYLDSTLPQDRVAEFERVCLESDKHLCEVAAGHQILTLVLGKAAEVPPQLRDRIYALASEGAQSGATPAQAAATAASAVIPPPVLKSNGQRVERPAALEVPEYLRSGRQFSLWPLALAAALVLLMAFVGLLAMGPLNDEHPLARLLGRRPTVAELPAKNGSESTPSEPVVGPTDAKATDSGPQNVTTSIPEGKTPAESSAATTADAATPSSPSAVVAAATPETPDSLLATPPAPDSATSSTTSSASPPNLATSIAAAESPTAPATASPIVAAPLATPASPPADAPPRQPMDVGRFLSDGQLLATLNVGDGFWYPKQAQEILVAGERLVVLPPFRPQIALPSAVTLTFAGEGAMQMDEPSDNPVPRVLVDYGRFVAATAGKPGAQVELDLAGVRGVLTLADADSVVAIKVLRWLPMGSDPEATDRLPVVEMYNANGRVSWQRAEQPSIDIPTRHVHVSYGNEPPQTHGPFLPPDWMDSRNVRPIDRDAGLALMRTLNPERPLNLTLQEMMKDRRVEMRALAARSLAALDDFEPALRELADPNQYSFWSGQFDALRQALMRSSESAGKLREAIALLRPTYAKDIYRILWGYSEEQLEKGGAADLVRFLDNDQVDVRVLAHLSLVAITGARESYRPERSPSSMKTAIQSWRDRLGKGAIIYRSPPAPFDLYKPITPPAGADARPATPAAAAPAVPSPPTATPPMTR